MKKFVVICLVLLLCFACLAGCNKDAKTSIPVDTISEEIPDTLVGLKIISRDSMTDYISDDILGVKTITITSYLAYDMETFVMYQIFINENGMSVVQLVDACGLPRIYEP